MATHPYLRICHNSPSLSLKPPSLILPKQHQSSSVLHFSYPASLCKPSLRKLSSSSSHSFVPAITASMASTPSTETKPFSVLFVCLGNICRSPAAEGVFKEIVNRRNVQSKFNIDSAGTINYHEGNQADPRMRAASKRRGIEITSLSRPIRPSDFRDFDLILAMDKQNRNDIMEAFDRWRFKDTLPSDAHKKVRLMCSYCKKHDETEVPDPYYGGAKGFEKLCFNPFRPRFLLRLALIMQENVLTSSASSSLTRIFVAFRLARRSFATRYPAIEQVWNKPDCFPMNLPL
ncbi:hypothetical protein HHK36_011342 [Tetracentron sinense]|uniref:acid phosphatase n=1 Tax=Tetracentron sinense TaxID=13715 RepID=A0A834ZBP6_TETSI|nr:hypothetical protein HHK36_011342 [Tetracentron sinense]